MDKIIGFVGSGNMATAIIGGILKANLVEPENEFVQTILLYH